MSKSFPKYMMVVDLETTGSDESSPDAFVLEVGYSVVTMPSFDYVYGANHVVSPFPDYSTAQKYTGQLYTVKSEAMADAFFELEEKIAPVVLDMHTKNGLWHSVQERYTPGIAEVDERIANALAEISGDKNGSREFVLGGSGVGHFDSRWIRKFMPRTAAHLTYYAIDVGVLRRFFRDICGVDVKSDPRGLSSGDAKTHRADEDAWAHFEEMRVFKEWILDHQ